MSGEFARIERFLRAFQRAGGSVRGRGVRLGPGDDAAIVEGRHPVAVTTDALVEGVHFRRDWATFEQVGHKSLAVNLSDLAAMGARPAWFTCALALPPSATDEQLEAVARGMAPLATRHGAVLVGGNFTRASEWSVTITAMGELPGEPLRRDTARPGDAVMVVGTLGVAAGELAWLREGRPLPAGPSALHEPLPLCAEGVRAAELLRCGIDVSDGLVQDLGHVAAASGVRIVLDFVSIPRSARLGALAAGRDEATCAGWLLAGGEDYALVLCGPREAAAALGATIVGRVETGAGVAVAGAPPGAGLAGHDHFAG